MLMRAVYAPRIAPDGAVDRCRNAAHDHPGGESACRRLLRAAPQRPTISSYQGNHRNSPWKNDVYSFLKVSIGLSSALAFG